MKHDMKTIREAPVPGLADSGPYTLADVDLIEKHRGKPYKRLRETVKALDAAKAEALVMSSDCPDNSCQACARCYDAAMADAARLREALTKYMDEFMIHGERGHPSPDLQKAGTSALAATDSAEWLEKHDAEVARRVRDEVVRLFRVAYDGPCVRGEKIVASRTVDQLLRGAE